MALNFPQNPEIDDTYTDQTANTTWKFDGLGWSVISQDETLTLTAGTNINIAGIYPDFTINAPISIPNGFANIEVAGQNTISADTTTDTFTLVAGNNISITTDATTDTITITGTVDNIDNPIDFTEFSAVTSNTPSGSGSLTYDNAGVFTYTPPVIPDTSTVLTTNNTSVTVGSVESPVEGGFLFFNTDTRTFAYTRADTYSKLGRTELTVNTSAASGGGALSYTNTNPASLNFTPAETVKETVQIIAPAATVDLDTKDDQIFYQTSNSTQDWTINVRGDATTTLNSYLATNESMTVVYMATQGATAYYPTQLQIDGANITPVWSFGNAPVAGTASAIDVYSYTITKTSDATYTVLANASFYQ